MPIASLKIRPGVNVELTPVLNEGGVSESNLIRYKDGLVEKLGGWVKYYSTSLGAMIRNLHAWKDLNSVSYLACGCVSQLTVINGGTTKTITPQALTVNIAVIVSTTAGSSLVQITDTVRDASVYDSVFIQTPISIGGIILYGLYKVVVDNGATIYTIDARINAVTTVATSGAVPVFASTNGSSIVSVTLNNHGYSVGSLFEVAVSTTIANITLFGQYTVFGVTSANVFTINTSNQASSTVASLAMNSASARYLYYIGVAPPPSGSGFGLGGGFGSGGVGSGVSPAIIPGSPIAANDWSLDNWGEILIAGVTDGPIFTWNPIDGYQNAFILYNGPLVNTGCFVAMPQRQIIAYGSSFTGIKDPLLVRWCDIDDFNTWIGTAVNAAGSFRIPTGNAIIGGMQSSQQALLWTDLDVWAMQFIDGQLVYGFNKLAAGCGLIAKYAATQQAGKTYWMSQKQFFELGNDGVQSLNCPVWDIVFQNLDTNNLQKIRAGANSQFNEVMWYFPVIGGSGENTMYVKYNTVQKAWDYGFLARTAWIDQSVLGSAIGSGSDMIVYQHEMGYNNDTVPMNSYFKTGYAALSDGDDYLILDQMIPDMKWGTYSGMKAANVNITFYTSSYHGESYTTTGPYTVTKNTDFISLRIRDRLLAMKVESNDMDSFWRIGGIRYRYAPGGKR